MTPQTLRLIAYRWHLRMNTADIAKALNLRECEVANALPEARATYPRKVLPLLATMAASTFHVERSR